MTNDKKVDILRVILGGSESEEVLSAYLKIAGDKILTKAFPFGELPDEVPEKYSMLQCEIAAYLLNKRGAEGQTSHSENGISRFYENADIPSSMLRTVTPYCGVIK